MDAVDFVATIFESSIIFCDKINVGCLDVEHWIQVMDDAAVNLKPEPSLAACQR